MMEKRGHQGRAIMSMRKFSRKKSPVLPLFFRIYKFCRMGILSACRDILYVCPKTPETIRNHLNMPRRADIHEVCPYFRGIFRSGEFLIFERGKVCLIVADADSSRR